MSRKILHVDLDAFFCAVEQLLDPSLLDKPFAVGGLPGQRGVIASASYAARRYGVRSAMPSGQALRLCPQLVLVPGRHHVYGEKSAEVMSLLNQAAPLVEQISIDEAFLDVSDDPRAGGDIARQLQHDIQEAFSLPTSWGVASSRLVAKIATEVGKPQGLVVVPPGEEAAFLSPLPVQMLWGIGPKTTERLTGAGIKTLGDLAGCDPDALRLLVGDRGPELASSARGIDDRPLSTGREPKSLSAERTFGKDLESLPALDSALLDLVTEVGSRLRDDALAGTTVRLKVRWDDFTTITRQERLAQPSNQDGEILHAARSLLRKAWSEGLRVRLLGVGVSGLGPSVRQLDLFDRAWERDERLLQAIDAIRARYGERSLRRASSLRRKRT
jgi:DNA polymerase-4